MKVAIVGSGISGLVAAHLLHRAHEITVFEADQRIGGHTHTVDVDVEGERHAIDTGFIVYNERTYPNFTRLLSKLGVPTRPTEMSFSVHCERTGLEWASRSLNTIFAQRRNLLRPSFHRLLGEILRFNREARELLDHREEKVALGDYLSGAGYSAEFVDRYIVPMGAAIWSASPSEFLDFPARSFVGFFKNHGLLERPSPVQWRVVEGGSRRYVDALTAPFWNRIVTDRPVSSVRRGRTGVELATRNGQTHRFDRVVLALHSDQAFRLLADPSELELRVLSAIRYQKNEVTLHTDASVMPRLRRSWASWNYRIPREPRDCVSVSYHMNRLQGLRSRRDFFVTLNGGDQIDASRVLARFLCHHPVFDADALAAQRLHENLDGLNRTHYCGAYWGHGFHEDGVSSAIAVGRSFGLEL
jgi:predicted NAD/FAD-binding protein